MARPIKDVLAQLIIKRGYGRQMEQEELQQVWLTTVGEPLARSARPCPLRHGTLEIVAQNSTVLQELSFRKPELLKKLQHNLPGKTIRDLRFRIGQV